jgi:hypothetical protein
VLSRLLLLLDASRLRRFVCSFSWRGLRFARFVRSVSSSDESARRRVLCGAAADCTRLFLAGCVSDDDESARRRDFRGAAVDCIRLFVAGCVSDDDESASKRFANFAVFRLVSESSDEESLG